jgi:hypothetical protein
VTVVSVAAGVLTRSVWVVVVVAVAGSFTTVVHEVKATAIARRGVRMISFFIVRMVPSRTNRRKLLWQMY